MEQKPILCLDFDGVIHSYKSGWKGARVIPDPPVPGSLNFIVTALEHFSVAIYSARSNQYGGIRAMKVWLRKWIKEAATLQVSTPKELKIFILNHGVGQCTIVSNATEWDRAVEKASYYLIHILQWPKHKPPAKVTLDDRALCFRGVFPLIEELVNFQSWVGKDV